MFNDLTICITSKNRTKVETDHGTLELLPNCLKSIKRAGFLGEVIISDWSSEDRSELGDPASYGMDGYVFDVSDGDKFSRGYGLNECVKRAKNDKLFFLDTDMLVSPGVISTGLAFLKHNIAFFPICFSFSNPEQTKGWWRKEGFGMSFVSRHMWKKVKGVPDIRKWGKEDNIFFHSLCRGFNVSRAMCDGYFHQWHPAERSWKNRFGKEF